MITQILRVVAASVLWNIGTLPLISLSPRLGALVVPLWLLATLGLGFMLHRWWMLALAPSATLALTYALWAGRGHYERGAFLGVSAGLATVGLVGLLIGWALWLGIERSLDEREEI